MKVLVIGNGAREHAIIWSLSRSQAITSLYAAPGNGGTLELATNVNVAPTDIEGLARVAKEKSIGLTVVGPEVPLANGIVDSFNSIGLPVFGPTMSAARIESSKGYAKNLMLKNGIPCATGGIFSSYKQAKEYVLCQVPPLVIKADGLAAGKGVTIVNSREEAFKTLSEIMEEKIFGSAGDQVVIEECLTGKEVSLLAFVDGKTIIPMVPACDYKRVFDGDEGPNTGGMGSFSPPAFFNDTLLQDVVTNILKPTVQSLAEDGIVYKGVLYAGLMITAEGPKVLEFNVRFGDPETQALLPRLKTDLLDVMLNTIEGRLDQISLEWTNEACVGVVMASAGYPGHYNKGYPIEGLGDLGPDVIVLHAGTYKENNQVFTDGGRVLTVVALGQKMSEARDKVYSNITRIKFQGCQYRKDIALAEVS